MSKGPPVSFDEFDGEVIDLADVDLSQCRNKIIVTERGFPHFFWGRFVEDHGRFGRDVVPLVRHPTSEGERETLVEIIKGKICRSFSLFASQAEPKKVKVLKDYLVRLPDGGTMRGFSVQRHDDYEEHVGLTRAVFGLCMQEYEELLHHFNACFRQESREGRITASNTRDNSCSLTRRWIPVQFPYIALAESGYYGGHVSLAGFLEAFTFLCPHGRTDRSYQMLAQSGANPELLDLAIHNRFGHSGAGEIYDVEQ